MKAVLVLLILAMVAKDASHLNDPYIMRGIAQGISFAVGLVWLVMNGSISLLKRYWPVFGYLSVSFISGIFSPYMMFALIQMASLTAVLIFSIAYFESQIKSHTDSSSIYFNTTIIVYAVVCTISLLLIKLNPAVVFGRVGDWSDLRAGIRFHGLYTAAGMMGAASGLLFGYVLLRRGALWWRVPLLIIALICLGLTQSRTFWVSTFATSIFVLWLYRPRIKNILVAIMIVTTFVVGTLFALKIKVDTRAIDKEARVGSISTLSGRVPLWEEGVKVFSKRPIIGYGSTMGSYALHNHENQNAELYGSEKSRSARSLSAETLHNGYLQSILDLGVLGLFFYISIFVSAVHRVYRHDKSRAHGAVLYGVLFMAIGNLGESIVYSASVSHSIIFWIVVVFALHKFPSDRVEDVPNEVLVVNDNSYSSKKLSILRSKIL